jgi:hypothetical protein
VLGIICGGIVPAFRASFSLLAKSAFSKSIKYCSSKGKKKKRPGGVMLSKLAWRVGQRGMALS